MDRLKNCPYCGGRAKLFNHTLKTIECECCVEISVSSETVMGAIEKWNRTVKQVKNIEGDNP